MSARVCACMRVCLSVCVCVYLSPPAGSKVELRPSFSPVLSALHQRAGGVSIYRLPHLTGPECFAGVPDTPRAPE